eukprot:2005057-Rhodomonas_salina.4
MTQWRVIVGNDPQQPGKGAHIKIGEAQAHLRVGAVPVRHSIVSVLDPAWVAFVGHNDHDMADCLLVRVQAALVGCAG